MIALALPMSLFLMRLPEHSRCVGSPMETGAPIVSSDGTTRYIESIAQIDDASSGNSVGWAYLTKGPKGEALYIQVKRPMDDHVLAKAGLHWLPSNSISSVGLIGQKWPWTNLKAFTCSGPPRP